MTETTRPSSVSSADAGRRLRSVAEELLDQRLVEAEFLADLLDGFLAGRGPGEIGGRVAGQRARQQEGDDHDPDQRRDGKHQPLADHGQHGGRSALSVARANGE
jgi:hypothetical protein